MPENNEEFLKRLLATFQVEAEEHLSALSSGLLELEKASPQERAGIIETIFRGAHSLKGAARSVNLAEFETACQRLESIFAALKREDEQLSAELLDDLHRRLDALRELLPGTEKVMSEESEGKASRGSIQNATGLEEVQATPRVGRAEDTVRVSIARLDSLVRQAEQLVSAKLGANQHAEGMRGLKAALIRWRKEWIRLKPEVGRLQRSGASAAGDDSGLGRLLEFLEWNETFMQTLETDFSAIEKPFERDRRALAMMVDGLLGDLKQTAMEPFSSLLILLRKLVRDLSREQGKLVELRMEGEELEMDRRILEELKDPLIHLVRNSIDHGIRKPEERQRNDKPPQGTISITILQQDSRVEIRVEDDGAGIDASRVRNAAIRASLISSAEAKNLADSEAVSLIFRSGISTSPIVTDISGRGLGLAIVREKVEQLGGTVRMQSRVGAGTTFHMVLPLTLSTFRGVVLQVADRLFALPTTHVERVLRIRREQVKTIENRETLSIQGQVLPLVSMRDVLGLEKAGEVSELVTALVVDFAGERIAFQVDAVRQEQEILLKNLGKQLVRVRNIAGATILGGGDVVPVLNVSDLMRSAAQARTDSRPNAVQPRKKTKPTILVVDDSITSRSLLKNILETNGYNVETAVDGMDAFTKIRGGRIQLIVSDVEMPRMDGFDLTARIRSEKRFADLPVVLVTALESREDRERGITVGANAYIVKSSFDQSNLLEVVNRLV